MGDLSDFKKGQTDGAHLAGAYVPKTATLLGVFRATVPKVITVYINHGRTPSAERNSGRKPKQTERDCHTLRRIVSKYHAATAAKVMADSIFILQSLFPQKESKKCFTTPTSTGVLQLLNF